MKYLKYILLICLILIDGYLIYHSTLTSSVSAEKSDKVTDVVVDTVDKVTGSDTSIADTYGKENIGIFIRKLFGHFMAFVITGVLSIMVGYLFIRNKLLFLIITLAHGLILAGTTELIQLFVEGRGASIKDVLIDYSGYLLGSMFVFSIYIIVSKIKENKELKYE